MTNETIKLRLNTPLQNFRQGEVIKLPAKNGVPTDRYWFRRLKDSAVDNCVSIVENKEDKPKKGDKKWDK